jgi:hypothetical protein
MASLFDPAFAPEWFDPAESNSHSPRQLVRIRSPIAMIQSSISARKMSVPVLRADTGTPNQRSVCTKNPADQEALFKRAK